jgi:DNA polymerase-3 subunit beta
MKIICDREKLLQAFHTASAVAPTRSPKAILQNVKVEVTPERATLVATDLEIGIRYEVSDVQVETPGSAVLSIQRFGSILRENTDEKLLLEIDGHNTIVRGERSEFRLPAEDPAEFPSVTTFDEQSHYEIPARLLLEMIRRTEFAIDEESTRYALGGVKFEFSANAVIAVGTDGRRLATMQGPCQAVGMAEDAVASAIIPGKALKIIRHALNEADAEIQIAVRDNDVLVRSQRATVYSRLVEGRYPQWQDVFPARVKPVQLELTVGPLHSAVRQAKITTSDESRGVEFAFDDGTLVLTSRAAESGQARVELPVAYDAAPITILLDPNYVADFLKVLDPEKTCSLELEDSETAAVFHTDDGYRYVVMPLSR